MTTFNYSTFTVKPHTQAFQGRGIEQKDWWYIPMEAFQGNKRLYVHANMCGYFSDRAYKHLNNSHDLQLEK